MPYFEHGSKRKVFVLQTLQFVLYLQCLVWFLRICFNYTKKTTLQEISDHYVSSNLILKEIYSLYKIVMT